MVSLVGLGPRLGKSEELVVAQVVDTLSLVKVSQRCQTFEQEEVNTYSSLPFFNFLGTSVSYCADDGT